MLMPESLELIVELVTEVAMMATAPEAETKAGAV
jgi:hypothetical protein